MLEILALGDHYQTVDPEQGLANLKPAATEVCRDRFRRIDRFTQLALIGSARCVQSADPGPKTGLYIGSRFASTGNTIAVHEKMVSAGVVPKPANFINTLSNSAGYFVARNLGLGDRNLFVSRGDASRPCSWRRWMWQAVRCVRHWWGRWMRRCCRLSTIGTVWGLSREP